MVRALGSDSERLDWWQVEPGRAINLTRELPGPPRRAPIGIGDTVIVEAEGDLWQLSPGAPKSTPTLLTGEMPTVAGTRALGGDNLYARVDGRPAQLRFSDGLLHVQAIEVPAAGANPRALSPTGDAAILTSNSADGTRLWLARNPSGAANQPVELWHGNSWIADKHRGTKQLLQYTSISGRSLHAWLLLPATGPHPLVVDVYSDVEYGPDPPRAFELTTRHFLHPQLFAELGYAVLLPSMPGAQEPMRSNPIDELTDGVLPALDAAIATGMIDGNRVAVVGQSAGGYSTLGLIAQTDRFSAAIASASYSDLVSLYGTFYGQRRYGDGGHPQAGQLLRIMQLERGYGRMGGPPWEQPERYRHNSPLTHVDKIRTPLMLVHGDMDFIPIQQAEQMFTALYRLDRQVRLARYHGEQHTVSGRANVLDVWSRIESWLETHLTP